MSPLELTLACFTAIALGASALVWRVLTIRIGRLRQEAARATADRVVAEGSARACSQRLTAVLAAATECAIVATDVHGTITIFNAGAERMLGWSADEIVGRATPTLFHDLDELGARATALGLEPGFGALCAAARRGEAETREWTYLRKDGSPLTVSLSVSGLVGGDGSLLGFIGIATDVTKRRAVEKMKDEFVSVVSHELRTPLTSIRGSLGLMAAGLLSAAPERSQRMLEIAVDNTDRLIRLINDMLDLERIESGRAAMQKTTCDVADLVAQAVDITRPVADRAGVSIDVPMAPSGRLWADPDRIIQVLTNLLSNAIKFSPEGGRVQIETEATNREVLMLVRDYGRGIPQDQLGSIFKRFQQVDASDSREKGGTGLGLAICQTIVEQHGGSIWAESEPGMGTTLVVALPAKQPSAEAATPLEPTLAAARA
jgi:PAS domain S-box-containing protein